MPTRPKRLAECPVDGRRDAKKHAGSDRNGGGGRPNPVWPKVLLSRTERAARAAMAGPLKGHLRIDGLVELVQQYAAPAKARILCGDHYPVVVTETGQAWTPDRGFLEFEELVDVKCKDIVDVVGSGRTYAATTTGGRVVTWDGDFSGFRVIPPSREVLAELEGGVDAVYSTGFAFAAKKKDGRVVLWGDRSYGGAPSPEVRVELERGVDTIYSNPYAFAARMTNGSLVVWGSANCGGAPSLEVRAKLEEGVDAVYSSGAAFAAKKADGSVVVWGHAKYGGAPSPEVRAKLEEGVVTICESAYAFAALKSDGSVVAWGGGGELVPSPAVRDVPYAGVEAIYSNQFAFAGKKKGGSVVVWGREDCGGAFEEKVRAKLEGGVDAVFSTNFAFAALKTDGSVVVWGREDCGGAFEEKVRAKLESGVVSICGTIGAFAALKTDGSVVTWGDPMFGGDSTGVRGELTGVERVEAGNAYFVAARADGRVVMWPRFKPEPNADISGRIVVEPLTDSEEEEISNYERPFRARTRTRLFWYAGGELSVGLSDGRQ